MRGLFIGRFQPFHMGHMKVVEEIIGSVDKLVLGIGSAQTSHTVDDPFTAGERHMMISESLNEKKIQNYYIIPLIDINRYSVWVSHVCSLVPKFDVVFTKNDLTAALFYEAGFEVRQPKLYDREKYSGKEVRRRMIEGEDWRSLVPNGTAMIIDDILGVERINLLSREGKR
jgi:nicotinamide-nucleotide adenylyltransferase